jgi:hypothetical protein
LPLVRLPDCLERLLATLALGRPLEQLERLAEAAGYGRLEELLLRPEQAEEVGLGDAGPPGDVLGRGALEAVVGELDEGCVENLVPPCRRRGSRRRRCHGA